MIASTVVRIGTVMPLDAAPECGQRRRGPGRGASSLLGLDLEFVFQRAHTAASACRAFPPVIAMPSSSSLASGGNSATILPS